MRTEIFGQFEGGRKNQLLRHMGRPLFAPKTVKSRDVGVGFSWVCPGIPHRHRDEGIGFQKKKVVPKGLKKQIDGIGMAILV